MYIYVTISYIYVNERVFDTTYTCIRVYIVVVPTRRRRMKRPNLYVKEKNEEKNENKRGIIHYKFYIEYILDV